MNRYQPTTPRTAFAVAALALTAITIGVMVILPTRMDGVGRTTVLARGAVTTPAATEVATRFGRIDVVATRAREVAMAQTTARKL